MSIKFFTGALRFVPIFTAEEHVKEISCTVFLNDDGLEKLRIKFHTDKGKVFDVVVQYESFY